MPKRQWGSSSYAGSFKKRKYGTGYGQKTYYSRPTYKKTWYPRKKKSAGKYMNSMYNKVYDQFTISADSSKTVDDTELFQDALTAGPTVFTALNNDSMIAMRGIYDSFKIVKISRSYWLGENDQFDKTNQKAVEMYTSYDPDARGRGYGGISDFNKVTNTKTTLLLYGKKYKMVLYPKYPKVVNGSQGTPNSETVTAFEPGSSPWFDASVADKGQFFATVGVSCNAMQFALRASQGTILRWKDFVHIQWKGRRNGQNYKS